MTDSVWPCKRTATGSERHKTACRCPFAGPNTVFHWLPVSFCWTFTCVFVQRHYRGHRFRRAAKKKMEADQLIIETPAFRRHLFTFATRLVQRRWRMHLLRRLAKKTGAEARLLKREVLASIHPQFPMTLGISWCALQSTLMRRLRVFLCVCAVATGSAKAGHAADTDGGRSGEPNTCRPGPPVAAAGRATAQLQPPPRDSAVFG